MKKTFIPGAAAPDTWDGPAFWFAFRKRELLHYAAPANSPVPFFRNLREFSVVADKRIFIGWLDGSPCFALALPGDQAPPGGMVFSNLRAAFPLLGEQFFHIAGRAAQLLDWDRNHRYCGRCGAEMTSAADQHVKICPDCRLTCFPRLSPAIIVAITRGREILLARAPRFPEGMFSVLAGFVEPGETLEAAVQREVDEEVGIRVKNIRYFGSQPWPFPNSLMIGFTAEYESGELRIDREEIVEAGWFRAGTLPQIPPKASIARRLIDAFVEAQS